MTRNKWQMLRGGGVVQKYKQDFNPDPHIEVQQLTHETRMTHRGFFEGALLARCPSRSAQVKEKSRGLIFFFFLIFVGSDCLVKTHISRSIPARFERKNRFTTPHTPTLIHPPTEIIMIVLVGKQIDG